ncbi:MAG: GyrI-like domain-containing protein [Pyrinomonadaceae bacterium]|nr:GyrI-like domain-containing protein [Pyrinomonadaceae bacterium]
MKKIDYKKEMKQLYSASVKEPGIVDVPEMNFIMVDGHGDPNTSEMFKDAVGALFRISYTLKFMIKKSDIQIDYGVMPLEGLWWADDMSKFVTGEKESWKWTAMIMQPQCVTDKLYIEAKEIVRKKKDMVAISKLRFDSFREGKSAQIMHMGPFSEEGPTIEKLHKFIVARGYKIFGKHHEIYMSDIKRTAPEKWKTIIRQPMKG